MRTERAIPSALNHHAYQSPNDERGTREKHLEGFGVDCKVVLSAVQRSADQHAYEKRISNAVQSKQTSR
jgi:hypothetical protein